MKLTLEISPSPGVQVQRSFAGEAVTIGRGRECDLTLARPMVSSEHARLDFQHGAWILTDLFSTNGTFVNGRRITGGVEIGPHDDIQLGEDGPRIKVYSFSAAEDVPAPISARAVEAPLVPPIVPERTPLHQPAFPSRPPGAGTPAAAPVPPPGSQRAPSRLPETKRGTSTTVRERKGTVGTMSPSWFHGIAATLVLFTAAGGLLAYWVYTPRQPARGYTFLGLLGGLTGSFLLLSVGLYTWRKRWGQEQLPGLLQSWLRVHLWLSLVGLWLIVLHAGFHLDGGSGTWTWVALALTIGTGLLGWSLYVQIPGQVYAQVGNLAMGDVEDQLRKLKAEIEDACAGGSRRAGQICGTCLAGAKLAGLFACRGRRRCRRFDRQTG